MERAVFLDKDGTVIENLPYNADPRKIRLMPYAGEALRMLHEHGFKLIIASNQSGVACGFFDETDMKRVEGKVRELLAVYKAPLTAFYYCPHLVEGVVEKYTVDCSCRKPKPGLIVRAAREWNIDVNASWFAGDILNDVEAGRNAGCRTILIDNGGETEWLLSPQRIPHHIVPNLLQAAAVIVSIDFRVA